MKSAFHFYAWQNEPFIVPAGTLGFNVLLFSGLAVLTIMLLFYRRMSRSCGRAELGGPWLPRVITVVFLIGFWISYIVVSSLQVYEVFEINF